MLTLIQFLNQKSERRWSCISRRHKSSYYFFHNAPLWFRVQIEEAGGDSSQLGRLSDNGMHSERDIFLDFEFSHRPVCPSWCALYLILLLILLFLPFHLHIFPIFSLFPPSPFSSVRLPFSAFLSVSYSLETSSVILLILAIANPILILIISTLKIFITHWIVARFNSYF